MRVVVTGSSGHLGEGLVRTLRRLAFDVVGVDVREGAFTSRVGSIADRSFVRAVLAGADAVLHTATLHNPIPSPTRAGHSSRPTSSAR